MQLMDHKTKLSVLIITVSKKSRKNTLNDIFAELFLVGSFWDVFLIKKKEFVLSKNKEIFAVYSIP